MTKAPLQLVGAEAAAQGVSKGDLGGCGQMSQKHYFAFIEFMLDACHDKVDYMTTAPDNERVIRAFHYNEKILQTGVKPECATPVIAFLLQGSLPRNEFKTFTGLRPRTASAKLGKLVGRGIEVPLLNPEC